MNSVSLFQLDQEQRKKMNQLKKRQDVELTTLEKESNAVSFISVMFFAMLGFDFNQVRASIWSLCFFFWQPKRVFIARNQATIPPLLFATHLRFFID